MQLINEIPHEGVLAESAWPGRSPDAVHLDDASGDSRLDFRRVSNHISPRRPGFYLILVRNELRHRSLREKPTLID
jgi:hypothetical protein